MKKFLITCIAALIGILGFISITQHFSAIKPGLTPFYYTAPFIMIVTILFHFILLKATNANPKQFISKFLAASGLKMMIYLTVIVIFIFTNRFQAKVFLISFLACYSIYTFIEIYFILKFLKK